ncbi:hypothetical protein D9M72_402270 [compost metagenome]
MEADGSCCESVLEYRPRSTARQNHQFCLTPERCDDACDIDPAAARTLVHFVSPDLDCRMNPGRLARNIDSGVERDRKNRHHSPHRARRCAVGLVGDA